ncbi:DNA repair protein RecN [Prevotella dentasini]|uniref:DNA repair protein RecN n=1 Tax=Prevotella dentasini TaxID=589537 RepID=UPI000469296A|nr:DNA repair protein RecN [Prevotella dentasini]
MLKHLYIKNFTLIDQLDIDFHPGFSVISGETGAGKSIILGAIGLLLGNRADSKQIKKGEKKCIIEAHFSLTHYGLEKFFEENNIDLDAEDTIIRRELSDTGKSRAFINDTPVPLQLMKRLGEQLVDIHSQHQNLLLQREDFQLNVVDIIADNAKDLQTFREKYTLYRSAARQLEQMKADIAKGLENEEFMRFQFEEINSAHLTDGEQEELEAESRTLSHSEEIKTALYETDKALNDEETGAVKNVKAAAECLRRIEEVFPKVKGMAERLGSVHIELQDIGSDVGSDVEDVDFDPNRMDSINQRLDKIYSLQQKFRVSSVKELTEIMENLKAQLHSIDNSDEALKELEAETGRRLADCNKLAKTLTALRTKTARKIEEEMRNRLVPLGIPNVRFQVQLLPKPLSADGADKIQFLFSANKSTEMQPVVQVASGGEIARVMLSLKAMISGAVKLPTIIFDEIDTGVSGKTAQKMALIMKEMGDSNRQVISITHLPQIAALGTSHYKVEKEETPAGTRSQMRELSQEQRVSEIAQMLSGADISEAALQNARELLCNGKKQY